MSFHGPAEMDDFFRHFFGQPFGEQAPRHTYGVPRQEGVGSGVVVTKDGYILTNNHVVDGADEVKVALQDGREFTAKVIGRDPKTDVAVIKIGANDLPTVAMADSDKVEVGDIVLAVALDPSARGEGDQLLLDRAGYLRLRETDPSETFAGLGGEDAAKDLAPLLIAPGHLGLLGRIGLSVHGLVDLHILDLPRASATQFVQLGVFSVCHPTTPSPRNGT